MPIRPVVRAARRALIVSCSVACALVAAPAWSAPNERDESPNAADSVATPSRNIFVSWFGTNPLASEATPTGPSRTTEIVDSALGLLGIGYRLGGDTPASGFDCSGMVRYVYRTTFGLDLPRRAEEIARVGVRIDRDNLKPGDLVFYKTLRRAVSHVGIYLGDNRFIHAPSAGKSVRVDDMSASYWAHRFTGARRVDE